MQRRAPLAVLEVRVCAKTQKRVDAVQVAEASSVMQRRVSMRAARLIDVHTLLGKHRDPAGIPFFCSDAKLLVKRNLEIFPLPARQEGKVKLW